MQQTKQRRERYRRISSLKELQAERSRLDIEIKQQTIELLVDAEMINDKVSVSGLMQSAYVSVYNRYSAIQKTMVGFRVARSLMGQLLNRIKGDRAEEQE